jgi:hypothetical protein
MTRNYVSNKAEEKAPFSRTMFPLLEHPSSLLQSSLPFLSASKQEGEHHLTSHLIWKKRIVKAKLHKSAHLLGGKECPNSHT